MRVRGEKIKAGELNLTIRMFEMCKGPEGGGGRSNGKL